MIRLRIVCDACGWDGEVDWDGARMGHVVTCPRCNSGSVAYWTDGGAVPEFATMRMPTVSLSMTRSEWKAVAARLIGIDSNPWPKDSPITGAIREAAGLAHYCGECGTLLEGSSDDQNVALEHGGSAGEE